MQFSFLHDTKIDFIGKRYFFYAVSAILLLLGIGSLIARGGPNYGIDFSGGILMQVSFSQPADLPAIRSALEPAIGKIELQSSKDSVIIRAKHSNINQDEFSNKVVGALSARFPQSQVRVDRTEYVGPAVGRHLGKQAFYALVFSFIGIIIYVAFRFHSSIWGIAGVIGIVHDVAVVFGLFSLFNKEVNLTAIAAFLTIAGYSINDTIVIFDRIRENLRYLTKENFGAIINRSVNDTLARTFITSFTVLLVVLPLFLFGGDVIHDFAFAMLCGLVVGSYSTVFICSPIVYEWEQFKLRRAKKFSKTAKTAKR